MTKQHLEPGGEHPTLIARTLEIPDSDTSLTEPLRVRIPSDMESDLDALEAWSRGQGHRHVTRSHMVRVALEDFITIARNKRPDIFE